MELNKNGDPSIMSAKEIAEFKPMTLGRLKQLQSEFILDKRRAWRKVLPVEVVEILDTQERVMRVQPCTALQAINVLIAKKESAL